MKHIFFCAGEASGDLHASNVIKKLAGYRISGIGGDAMIDAGMQPLFHIQKTAVMGFFEVMLHYPRLRAIFKKTCTFLQENNVDLLVLVDYPGFNLKLADFAHRLQIPVLYYITPKVWAWGRWRIKQMKKNVDRAAVILPFEEALLQKEGIHATFVGNPISEVEYPNISRLQFLDCLGISEAKRVLGLLPGSRQQEIRRILPEMIKAGQQLIREGLFDICVISKSKNLPDYIFTPYLPEPATFKLYPDNPAPIQKYSDFLIVKSGTSTLETALQIKSFVVVYRTSLLSAFIMRRLVRIDNFSLANIICEKQVVPELFQERAKAARISEAAKSILKDPSRIADIKTCFEKMKQRIFSMSPSDNVVNIIRDMGHG